MIYPLFRRTMQKMGATWMFSNNGSTARSGGGPGWSMQLSDRKNGNKNKFGHPLSRSTLTASDSNEHIVETGETTKDGINITTETAVVTSNASSGRDEESAYPPLYHGKPAGNGYSFHVSSKSQGNRGYEQ